MNLASPRRLPSFLLPLLLAVASAILITGCGNQPIFSYQGRLLNASGAPVGNGTYAARYVFYTAASGGSAVYTETENITVEDGLFNTEVGIADMPTEIFQQPLWMEVTINGETLTPRQALRGSPYAFSLAGGAVVAGNETVTRTLTAVTPLGDSTGSTVLAYNVGQGHGIVGSTLSTWVPSGFLNFERAAGVVGVSQNEAYGGYFNAEDAIGLYAEGDATAGVFIGDILVSGNCSGCVLAYTARNVGDTPIAAGDLVAAAGVEVDPNFLKPVLLVRRATSADDAILGVSDGGLMTSNSGLVPSGAAADAGTYVSVVVQGLAQVRVSGLSPVAIGNRLTASGEGAVASPDAVSSVARVMSDPDANGLVWAMISGQ